MLTEGAQLKGLMGLPGWQPPCLRAALFAHASRATRELWLRKSERKVCPSTLHPPFLFPSLTASPLSPGSLATLRRHPLGPLDPQVPFRHRMSSLRGVSFLSPYLPSVLPGAASRYSRIPVSPKSALHRRRINTGRHPNSLEVNASFP